MYEDHLVTVDLSYYQGSHINIDWQKMLDVGQVRGAWNRLNYGRFKDPEHDNFALMEARVGIARSFYTFPLPHQESPQSAYDNAMRMSGGDSGNLPWMVDAENPPGVNLAAAVGPQRLADWYIDFGRRLQAGTGRVGIMYGGFLGMTAASGLREVYPDFWVANYGTNQDYGTLHYAPGYRPYWNPKVPAPWSTWSQFQHSGGNGRVPGIPLPCDTNIVSREKLSQWNGGNLYVPTKPAEQPQPKVEAIVAPPIHEFPDGAQYFLTPCTGPVVKDHNGQPTDLSGGKEMIWVHLENPARSFDAQVSGLVSPLTVHIPAEDQAAIDRFERYGIANGPMKRPPLNND